VGSYQQWPGGNCSPKVRILVTPFTFFGVELGVASKASAAFLGRQGRSQKQLRR